MDARFAAVTKRISVMQSLLQGAALSELPVVSQIQTRALLATLQSVQCCGNKKGLQETAGDWLAKVAEMCGKLRHGLCKISAHCLNTMQRVTGTGGTMKMRLRLLCSSSFSQGQRSLDVGTLLRTQPSCGLLCC